MFTRLGDGIQSLAYKAFWILGQVQQDNSCATLPKRIHHAIYRGFSTSPSDGVSMSVRKGFLTAHESEDWGRCGHLPPTFTDGDSPRRAMHNDERRAGEFGKAVGGGRYRPDWYGYARDSIGAGFYQ